MHRPFAFVALTVLVSFSALPARAETGHAPVPSSRASSPGAATHARGGQRGRAATTTRLRRPSPRHATHPSAGPGARADASAPAYLNHAFTTVDHATYQALLSDAHVRENFARVMDRWTITGTGEHYAGLYLQGGDALAPEVRRGLASGKLRWQDVRKMGEAALDPGATGPRTYLETFEAGHPRFPVPAGLLGVATSDETVGATSVLRARLAAAYPGKVRIEARTARGYRSDGALQSESAFDITTVEGPYGRPDSQLSVWHQTYPTVASTSRPMTRAEYLRRANGKGTQPRLLKNITGVEGVSTVEDIEDFARQMHAMGLRVVREPSGAVRATTAFDGETRRRIVMRPTRDGTTGIQTVHFALHAPLAREIHVLGNGKLTLGARHPAHATLELPLSAQRSSERVLHRFGP